MSDICTPQQLFNDFVQIGVVVADLEKSIQALETIFGIGPFRVIDWPPADRTDIQRWYYGEPTDFTARMAFTELGTVELELIQPVAGRSIWADFLAEHGPGIHHIRFNVSEMDPVLSYLAEHGVGVAQMGSGIRPGTVWANLDTERLVGFTIEVMRKLPGSSGRTPLIVDGKVQA